MVKEQYESTRRIVPEDFRKIVLDFTTFNTKLPDVGIYDEPVRYYKANQQWAKLIEGFLDWMTTPAFWPEAEDENYTGILQMLIFIKGIISMPVDCGEIEDCIENSPTIINIIDKGSSGFNPGNFEKPIEEGTDYESSAEEPVITPEEDCGDSDKDKLWGAISEFIDFVHATNNDLFEQITLAKSASEGVRIMIGLIPAFELTTPEQALATFNWLLDFVSVSYAAATTEPELYQIKCDLFCDAVANDCNFTIGIAMDYFAENTGIVGLAINQTIAQIIPELYAATALDGFSYFCCVSFLQLSIASLGETFVNAHGLDYYLKAAQAGSLSGDPAWQVWCTECAEEPSGEWLLVLDFANNYVKTGSEFVVRNAFTLMKNATPPGTAQLRQAYQKGAIFERDVAGETSQRIIQFASPVELSHARINWRRSDGDGTMTQRVSTPLYAPANSSTTSSSFGWTSSTPITNVGGTFNAVSQLNIDWGLLLNSQLGESELRYIEIRGQGALPTFAS